MDIDQYAPCPCGSGKKIKFCSNCKSTIGELEKLLKMAQGGQLIAALDRANHVLEKHPTAAWVLAVKGRLLLQLRELDALAENAERFLRLQPTNPLALTQRAAAQSARGDVEAAAISLLEALGESGESIDTFVLDVCTSLAFVLAESGILLSARAFASLPLLAEGYAGAQQAAMAMGEINRSDQVNGLLKWLPELPRAPSGAVWAERFGEAIRLLDSHMILQAEAKLESIDHQHPRQEAVVRGLLHCAIWRADPRRQSTELGRLAEIAEDEEAAARLRAMALLVDPDQAQLSPASLELAWNVDNLEPVEAALLAHETTSAIPPDALRAMAEENEQVPPRAGYQLLGGPPPSDEQTPAGSDIPEVLATLLVYGRQTDRPPRIEAASVLEQHRERVERVVAQALERESAEADDVRKSAISFYGVLLGVPPILRLRMTRGDLMKLQRDYLAARLPERFLNLQLPVLDGKSPAAVAEDPQYRSARLMLVRLLENYDSLATEAPQALDAIREALRIEPLGPVTIGNRSVDTIPPFELNRIEPEGLDVDALVGVMERARSLGCTPAARRMAERLVAMEPEGERVPAKLMAFMTLVDTAASPEESLDVLERGKVWAESAEGVNPAPLLLSEIGRRIMVGDAEGLQRCIQTLTTDYGTNPTVMTQLQQLLVGYGLINPDGSPRSAPAAAPRQAPQGAAPAPGVWTPDASGGPAPAPSAQPGQAGGSKLWLPGMD